MLKLKMFTFVSDEDIAKLVAERERPKPRWRTITVDDWDRGKKLVKAKLVDDVYLWLKWESGWDSHYILNEDKTAVEQEIACERKRETVERRDNGNLILIPRYC